MLLLHPGAVFCTEVLQCCFHMQSHSMPTPHQLPDPLQPQQRSISPGGYEQFSLSDNFPSLHVLSPPPQQQTSSLSRQQLPPFDMSTGAL